MSSYLPGQRDDEGVDVERSAELHASTPGESRYPRLLKRVLRDVRESDLFEAIDTAALQGMTLGEYVEKLTREMERKLARDAAAIALRELRRFTPPRGMANV